MSQPLAYTCPEKCRVLSSLQGDCGLPCNLPLYLGEGTRGVRMVK